MKGNVSDPNLNSKNIPKDIKDKITNALNVAGTFFPLTCAEAIKKSGWNILDMEYPVAIKEGFTRNIDSRLDIWASYKVVEGEYLLAMVECKKNDPKYKTWVFFPKYTKLENLPLFQFNTITCKLKEGRETPQSSADINITTRLDCRHFPDIGYHRRINPNDPLPETYYECREVKDNWQSTGKNIYDACSQVAIALHSLMKEQSSKYLCAFFEKNKKILRFQTFIPIVITTANLLTCKFDIKDINLEKGEVPPEKVTYKPMNWVAYEFPLSSHLWAQPVGGVPTTITDKVRTKKISMFIVKSEYTQEFFEKMKNYQ